MEKAKKFTDLIVWQKAHQLTLSSYKMTSTFPKEELFGLTSQARRAAVSIPANIAEGSLEELKYYLILSRDLNYYKTDEIFKQAEEVGKLIYSYSQSIEKSF